MKKIVFMFPVIIIMIGLLMGCTKSSKVSRNDSGAVVLKIPHYKAGENVGAKFFLPQVARFNDAYKGKYEIVIEEIPQDEYRSKIKLLQQQNKLPPLIEGGDRDYLENVIIKNELFYDLKPWINSMSYLKSLLMDDSVEYNTRNGKIFSMPLAVIRPIGLYYNKEMFDKAGITKPISQMSLNEFDQALENLKAAGFNPLALMTGENAWTSQLLLSAILANQTDGTNILKDPPVKQYDYTTDNWIQAFTKLQKYFQEYTTGNAIGAVYADAANNFLNERAAIIANGPWMIGDFYDTTKTSSNFDKKVGAEIYPGGYAIATIADYTWWIPKNLPKEEIKGALAFLEFMYRPEELETYMLAEGGTAPKLENSEDFNKKLNPIIADLNNSIKNDMKATIVLTDLVWPNQISQNEFGKLLPKLVDNSLTPAEFAKQLTSKAQQFK